MITYHCKRLDKKISSDSLAEAKKALDCVDCAEAGKSGKRKCYGPKMLDEPVARKTDTPQ